MEKSDQITISIIQPKLIWQNKPANLAHIEELIWSVTETPNIFALPEMFNTGYTINKDLAEPVNGSTMLWMRQLSAQHQADIVGSLLIKESGNVYNRLIWMSPDGHFKYYDKHHLFTFAGEHHHLTPGISKNYIEFKGWRILPLLCYDIRFPAWCAQAKHNYYDLMLVLAGWPQTRISAWNALLKARAIENSAYVIGVNCMGINENGVQHVGHSVAHDYKGNTLCFLSENIFTNTVRLCRSEQNKFRAKFPVLEDADAFQFL